MPVIRLCGGVGSILAEPEVVGAPKEAERGEGEEEEDCGGVVVIEGLEGV